MLVLTRKVNQTLKIGDDIDITIISVKGKNVRIGVKAPKDIPVHREEIYERIQNELRSNEDDFLDYSQEASAETNGNI